MTKKLLAVAALIGLAVAAVWLRPSPPSAPSQPSVPPHDTDPAPATPAPEQELDVPERSRFAGDQVDAKQRNELETVARISDELGLSAGEREAVMAALAKLQAGRRAEFTKLIEHGASEQAVTAGLLAHHRAFDEDIGKALGEPRATEFRDRYNNAYGQTLKKKARDGGRP